MVVGSTMRMVVLVGSTAVPMGPEVVVLVLPSGMPGSLGAVPVLDPAGAILLG